MAPLPVTPGGLASDVAVAVVQSESVPRGDWEGCGLWHPSQSPPGAGVGRGRCCCSERERAPG